MNHRRIVGSRAAVAALCGLLLWPALAACAGDEPRPGYSRRVAEQLRADVARVRTAAEDHRQRAARVALHRLTRHVASAQARGELPAAKVRRILLAADLVAEDIAALPDKTTGDGKPATPARRSTGDHHGAAESGRHRSPAPARKDQHHRRDDHKDDGRDKPEGWEAHKEDD
jgi:hypothetical protein